MKGKLAIISLFLPIINVASPEATPCHLMFTHGAYHMLEVRFNLFYMSRPLWYIGWRLNVWQLQISKQEVSECLTVTFPRLYLQRMFNGTCLLVQSRMNTKLKQCNTPVSLGSLVAIWLPVTVDTSGIKFSYIQRHCLNCRLNAAWVKSWESCTVIEA